MSIEQTKLFKESIETPILKTNEVKAQVVEASQVASDDIWVLGYNLENVLFGDDVIEQIVDSTELLKSKYEVEPTYGAEQIVAFQMKVPQEYKGKYISSVTLRRRDTNTGNEQPIAQREQVYLYANCMTSYKEVGNNNNNINENDFIVDTFYSIDKHRQTVDDGLQTTWNFDEPIKIKRNYNYIRFYCTRVRGEAQTNINLRSSNVKFNNIQGGNKRGLLDGWITIDQAGPIGFTTEFTVNLLSKELGFITHIQNTSIHLDEQKNNLLNSISDVSNDLSTHANNENVHITTDQKEKLKTLHILQTSYNIHKNNKTIHITEGERNKWNSIEIPEPLIAGNNISINTDNYISVITTDDITNSDMIPTSSAVFNKFYEAKVFNNFNTDIYTDKPDSVGTIVLSKKHFISGNITKISLPHDGHIGDQGGILTIQVFGKNDNQLAIYYSDNYYVYAGNESKRKYEWTFTDCVIPDEYKAVHLSMVNDYETTPSIGSSNNRQIRINCLAKNGDKNENVVFAEDDDCRVYWKGNTNGGNYVAIIEVEYFVKRFDETKLKELSSSLDNHIGNDSHLTIQQKNDIAKIGTLENNLSSHEKNNDIHVTVAEKDEIGKITTILNKVDNHIGDETHLTSDDKTQIAKISDLTTKYNNVTTILNNSLPDIETFSTLDSGNYVIKTGGKSNATGVQLSREHFTTGSIKVVEICHVDGMNAADIRLCAIVFNHGEDENTPKTLDDCIFSVNTQTQTSGVGGSMCFRFNNLELPDDYEFVRFLFAKGDTVIPVHNDSNTVTEARVQVLAPKEQSSEGEYAESPDDECKVMHISSTSNWYPHVRVMKTVLGYSDIVSLLNRISALESRVSELENS